MRLKMIGRYGREQLMAEKWIQGILGYNHKNDRYGLLVTDLWEIDGFSCGNRLQVEIAGEWIDTHMEMDWSTGKGVWYLTGTDFKGAELENKKVRVLRDR